MSLANTVYDRYSHTRLPRNSRFNRNFLWEKCAVYALVNEEMGHICYIGSSTNVYTRVVYLFRKFKLGNFGGRSAQKAYNLYGERAISVEILEEVSFDDRLSREKYWISLYLPEGNIMHTPRDKERMKKIIPSIILSNKTRWKDGKK